MEILRPHPELLKQNLVVGICPEGFMSTLKCKAVLPSKTTPVVCNPGLRPPETGLMINNRVPCFSEVFQLKKNIENII